MAEVERRQILEMLESIEDAIQMNNWSAPPPGPDNIIIEDDYPSVSAPANVAPYAGPRIDIEERRRAYPDPKPTPQGCPRVRGATSDILARFAWNPAK